VRIEVTAERDRSYVQHVATRVTARLRLVALIVAALFVFLAWPGVQAGGLATTGSVGIIVMVLEVAVLIWIAPWRAARRAPPLVTGLYHYVIDDEWFQVSKPLFRSALAWSEIAMVVETPRAFILWTPGRRMRMDMPRAALSGDQLTEFREFLASRKLLPARPTTVPAPAEGNAIRPAAPGPD
jgi:hypothetical protein